MSRRISSVRRHTLRLGVGTALGALIAAGAQAQTNPPRLPTPADVDSTRSSLLGPVISSGNGELNVGLRSRSTVIDWKGFNIPEGQRANFTNESVLSGNVAVLNRDISGNTSQLLGALNAGKDVAVWVYNPNGIMVGANAAFNTGSLVLTTLNPDVNDFLSSGNSYRLQGAANSTTGITAPGRPVRSVVCAASAATRPAPCASSATTSAIISTSIQPASRAEQASANRSAAS